MLLTSPLATVALGESGSSRALRRLRGASVAQHLRSRLGGPLAGRLSVCHLVITASPPAIPPLY